MVANLLSETGLSLERLQSFCRVAEVGGVTRAAKGDAVKQSLYSRQIKELEEFFGAELMRRKGRGIRLTPAGQRLHNMAREQFAGLNDFKAECRGQQLEIVIGAGESLIQWLLLPQLPAIEKRLQSVRYKLLNLTSAEIVHHLNDGVIDFGIVRKGEVTKPLKNAPLGIVAFSLFVPKELQAMTKGKEFGDFIGALPLAILEGEGSFRRQLGAVMRNINMPLSIKVECSSFPLVARALAVGTLAGILPSIAAAELRQMGMSEVPSEALKAFDREICIAWNPRQLRVRSALEKTRKVLMETLQVPPSEKANRAT
jgi:DNA-binding transcriptional LysR family regulator